MVSPALQCCPCWGPCHPEQGGMKGDEEGQGVIWEEAYFLPISDVVGSTCIQFCSKDKQTQNRNHIYPSEMTKKPDKYLKQQCFKTLGIRKWKTVILRHGSQIG